LTGEGIPENLVTDFRALPPPEPLKTHIVDIKKEIIDKKFK
jgi:hypothetical protein